MAVDLAAVRALFLYPNRLWRAQRTRRHGNRATIEQPGRLLIAGQVYPGTIENVGISGARFAAKGVPAGPVSGTLTGPDGRSIEVEVKWHRHDVGVGLAFSHPR
jgi:hypothetical protein